MMLTPNDFAKFCKSGVLLVMLFCILFTYNKFGYKKKTGPLWYGHMRFYSNESEIENVKEENTSFYHSETSSLKLKGSKTARRISLDSVIKLVPYYEENETYGYEYKHNTFSGTSDKRLYSINESSKLKAQASRPANNYNDNTVKNNMFSTDNNKEIFNMKLKNSEKKRYSHYSGNSLIKMVLPSENNKSFGDSEQKQKFLSETANPKLEALKIERGRYDRGSSLIEMVMPSADIKSLWDSEHKQKILSETVEALKIERGRFDGKSSLIKMALSRVEKEASNVKLESSQHKQIKINKFSVIRPSADIKLPYLKLKDSRQTHTLDKKSVTNHMLYNKTKKLYNMKFNASKKEKVRYKSNSGNNLVSMVLPSEYKTSSKDSKPKQNLLNNTYDLQLSASEKGREGSIDAHSLIKMVLLAEYRQSVDISLKDPMYTQKQKLSSERFYLQLKGSENGRENKTLVKMVLSSTEKAALNLKLIDSKQKKLFSKISVLKPSPLGAVAHVTSFHCRLRNVKLFRSPRPLIGLLSFPGSGNTWTRHLIQQMTGIGTSSVYCDETLQSKGFPYECERDRRKTIVVKTHLTKYLPMFKKVVLLVRNPYDAFIAFANFYKAGHTGRINRAQLINEIGEYFKKNLIWFTTLFRNTTEQFKGPVHVLQYSKLKTDMKTELRSLAIFLNTEVTDRDIDCTYELQEGYFHRHTPAAEHSMLLRTVYDKDQLLQLRKAARIAEKLIKEAYNIDTDLGGSVEEVIFH